MNRAVIWWLCALVLTAIIAPIRAADSASVDVVPLANWRAPHRIARRLRPARSLTMPMRPYGLDMAHLRVEASPGFWKAGRRTDDECITREPEWPSDGSASATLARMSRSGSLEAVLRFVEGVLEGELAARAKPGAPAEP